MRAAVPAPGSRRERCILLAVGTVRHTHYSLMTNGQGNRMDEQKVEYVGFWARFGASIIDTVLMLITWVAFNAKKWG